MFRHKDEGDGASPSTYQMHQRMFSIGDDFWIENGAGQRVFKVDGKALPGQDDALVLAVAIVIDQMSHPAR